MRTPPAGGAQRHRRLHAVFARLVGGRHHHAARSPVAADGVPAGSGMGLAIAAGLVQAHHGDITVVNRDKGSRFEVRLPLSKN